MVSFSGKAKAEICAAPHTQKERFAFLYGVLLSARQLRPESIVLQTECETFAALLPGLVRSFCPTACFDTEYRARNRRLPLWIFSLKDPEAVSALLKRFSITPPDRTLQMQQISSDSLPALLGGIFAINGSVTDPQRDYHLEIALPDADLACAIQALFAQAAIPMKLIARKQEAVLYLKHNEAIGDALTWMGAPNATLDLIGTQVLKSVRGQTNRRTNCDLANIDKTVRAGEQQISDILLIAERQGLDTLPQPLCEMAKLRLENPDACLRELGAMTDPPISRSGVNHRLQRLTQLAAQIRKSESKALGENDDEKQTDSI